MGKNYSWESYNFKNLNNQNKLCMCGIGHGVIIVKIIFVIPLVFLVSGKCPYLIWKSIYPLFIEIFGVTSITIFKMYYFS